MLDSKIRVNILDADFIPFFVCYNKKGKPEKSADDCIKLCDDFIRNMNGFTRADKYGGYLTKGKCFRYTVNPDYKSNRKYTNMPAFMTEVKEHLIGKHNFTWQEGYEADDLVVSFKAQNPQYDVIIVSPDKDILNLEGKHLNPRKMAWKRTTKQEAEDYFWSSMIIGDQIDGIKGIPGKGPAAAEMMVVNCKIKAEEMHSKVLTMYIECFGEYEGIREFHKNYMSLKMVDNVLLNDITLNDVIKKLSEQTKED